MAPGALSTPRRSRMSGLRPNPPPRQTLPMEDFEKTLMDSIRTHKVIWKTQTEGITQKEKDSAWRKVAARCGKSVKECRTKYYAICARFRLQTRKAVDGGASTWRDVSQQIMNNHRLRSPYWPVIHDWILKQLTNEILMERLERGNRARQQVVLEAGIALPDHGPTDEDTIGEPDQYQRVIEDNIVEPDQSTIIEDMTIDVLPEDIIDPTNGLFDEANLDMHQADGFCQLLENPDENHQVIEIDDETDALPVVRYEEVSTSQSQEVDIREVIQVDETLAKTRRNKRKITEDQPTNVQGRTTRRSKQNETQFHVDTTAGRVDNADLVTMIDVKREKDEDPTYLRSGPPVGNVEEMLRRPSSTSPLYGTPMGTPLTDYTRRTMAFHPHTFDAAVKETLQKQFIRTYVNFMGGVPAAMASKFLIDLKTRMRLVFDANNFSQLISNKNN